MQRDLKNLHLRRNKFKFEKYIRSFDREKERLVSNELHHVDGTRGWLAVGQDSFDLPRHRLSRIWRYASPLGIHTLGDRRRLWEASRGKEQSGVSIFEKYLLKQREREKKKKKERDGWKGNFAGTWIREYFNNLDSRVLRESRQKWLVPLYNPFVASRIIRAEEHIFPRSEELSRFSKRTFPSFRFSICWTNGKKHRSKSVPYHIPPPQNLFFLSPFWRGKLYRDQCQISFHDESFVPRAADCCASADKIPATSLDETCEWKGEVVSSWPEEKRCIRNALRPNRDHANSGTKREKKAFTGKMETSL